MKSEFVSSAGTALAGLLLVTGPARAGSVSFSDTFNINLQQVDTSGSYIAGVTPNRLYRGTANPTLMQFDTLGGTRTLDSVTFNFEITFQGEVLIYQAPQFSSNPTPGGGQSGGGGYGQLQSLVAGPSGIITPIGWSSLLGLRADADFDPIQASGDDDFSVNLDEFGEGSDFTNTGMAGFLGTDALNAFVCAMVELSYPNKGGSAGNAGNAGNQGLTAFGLVQVVYAFSEIGDPTPPTPPTDPTVIPTPGALGMGVLALLGLAVRRRR